MIGCNKRIRPGGFTVSKRYPSRTGFYQHQTEIKEAAEAALRRDRWKTRIVR